MRALLVLFALTATASAAESPFRPFDGRRETIAALAKASGRPVLVAFLHDGCEPSVALRRAPDEAAFHDIRAECLERLGRSAAALAEAERAAALAQSEGDRREFRRALRERRKRCDPAESAK